jgi:nucleoside-diphosphate-sugar epimerase
VIRENRGHIPAVILRIAGVYDDTGHSIPITQNIRRIAERELESYFFPGDSKRGPAYIHLDDLINLFEQVVDRRGQTVDDEIFLVAEDECLSYEKLQDLIGELIHGVEDWPTIRIPKALAKAGAWVKEQWADSEDEKPFIRPWMVDLADAHYPVDNRRAREELGWRPVHRLSATLPIMIAQLKEDPRRWYETNDLPLPDEQTLTMLAELHGTHTART